MDRNTIEKILNFLKEKEGHELPKAWFDSIKKIELIKELENHPDGTQFIYYDHLDLSDSNITKLPDNLHVGGVLNLWGCKQLTKLPDNLHLTQSLIIIGSSIEEIPDNLYVGWILFIYNTPLAKKYTDEEIREMITSKGGTLIGKISR